MFKSYNRFKYNKMEQKNFIAFWRPSDPNGHFGQWFKSDLSLNSDEISALPNSIKNLRIFADFPEVIENLSDIEFSCAEQFMMTGKAYLFNDHTIAAKIVQEPNPKNHKSLGRKIKNFDQIVWDKYSGDIVTLGSYLKFSQNPTLKNLLLETQNA